MKKDKIAIWLLRVGLALVYFYASIEIYNDPAKFLKYVPGFVTDVLPMDLFLPIFGVIEVGLTVWLLTGWKGKYASMVSLMMMAGIVLFNLDHFGCLFRNVAIAFGSSALMFLEWGKEKAPNSAPAAKASS